MTSINFHRAQQILRDAMDKRILVIGDLMLDQYIRGQVERISPEAPVPVVRVISESYSPGGAANVVNNLHALRARSSVIGRIGADPEGQRLKELLQGERADLSGLIETSTPTVLKTRIIAHHQHVVRVDREQEAPLEENLLKEILNRIGRIVSHVDGVIVSDYGKGLIVPEVVAEVIRQAALRGIPVVVDPKGRDFTKYRGATCIKPNEREAGEACGIQIRSDTELDQCGQQILDEVSAHAVLITRGEKGVALFRREHPPVYLSTVAQEVYDVSGAGDTSAGVFTLCLTAGATYVEAAFLSNVAGGVVVGKLGTATASPQEILHQVAYLHEEEWGEHADLSG